MFCTIQSWLRCNCSNHFFVKVEDVVGDLEDHDGVIRTTKPRGRPKRRHSEGVGNHSSKKPRTASVEVTIPADTTTSYNLPSASSSIMSEVVNVILAQVASQQRQQLQQHQSHDIIASDELQENVEVVTEPTSSNDLIIIENGLDSTNTVEVWAGGEGGGANMTGEVNQILERIGVGQSGETIQDAGEGDVVVTEAAEEIVSQEIITEETPCEEALTVTEEALTVTEESLTVTEESLTVTAEESLTVSAAVIDEVTSKSTSDDVITCNDQVAGDQIVAHDQVVVDNQVSDQVVVNNQVASDQITMDDEVSDQVVVNDQVASDLVVSEQEVVNDQVASDQVVVNDQIVLNDQVASNQVVVNDQVASDQRLGDDQVIINNGGVEVDKSTTPHDNVPTTSPPDDMTLCKNDDITTIDNDDHKV